MFEALMLLGFAGACAVWFLKKQTLAGCPPLIRTGHNPEPRSMIMTDTICYCGEAEAIHEGLCADCLAMETYEAFPILDDPGLSCHCEDSPCCGC